MKAKYSFYGRTEPKWLLTLSWVLIFCAPIALFMSSSPRYAFWYTTLAGITVIASSFKLKSAVLLVLGILITVSYYTTALLLMGTGP